MICTLPFQTLVDIDLGLKRRSPFARTIVSGIPTCHNGYLPAPEQYQLGGCEIWLGPIQCRNRP